MEETENDKMIVRYPGYYREFRCIGGECPDTCCAGWRIGIDRKTWKRYRRVKGSFGKRLKACMDGRGQSFFMDQGKCPFLNRQGLCDIYCVLGRKSLCRTCRDYPRHMEVFDGLREASLSLSCPEAARLILGWKEAAALQEKGKRFPVKRNKREGQFLELAEKIREGMFSMVTDRSVSLRVRSGAVLALAHDIQKRLDQGKPELCHEVLKRYRRAGAWGKIGKRLEQYKGRLEERRSFMQALFEVTRGLETVRDGWPDRREQCVKFLADKEGYEELRQEFLKNCRGRGYEYENLMIYFLYVYVLGAVYDGQIYDKVKFAVVSCLLIQEIEASYFYERRKRKNDDRIRAACMYSREVEHSDRNLEGMEAVLGESSLFSLEKLLTCIMAEE